MLLACVTNREGPLASATHARLVTPSEHCDVLSWALESSLGFTVIRRQVF